MIFQDAIGNMLNRKGSAEILSSIAEAVISIIQENEDADDGIYIFI